MLATLPAGLLVLAVGWGRIGPTLVPAVGSATGVLVVQRVRLLATIALTVLWTYVLTKTSRLVRRTA
jgi:hypothetical protein